MLWIIGLPILGILAWLGIAFAIGWAKGERQFGAVTFLMERPVDDWPHMPLRTMTEIHRLVGLIREGKVLHIALWSFLEARPALRDEVLRLADVLPPLPARRTR